MYLTNLIIYLSFMIDHYVFNKCVKERMLLNYEIVTSNTDNSY